MQSPIESYRDLTVWQKSLLLCEGVYDFATTLPSTEKYGLIPQLKRAVVSISANIAEGYGREHIKEYIHHLAMAKGSLFETETLLTICVRVGLSTQERVSKLFDISIEVCRMLVSLIRKLKASCVVNA